MTDSRGENMSHFWFELDPARAVEGLEVIGNVNEHPEVKAFMKGVHDRLKAVVRLDDVAFYECTAGNHFFLVCNLEGEDLREHEPLVRYLKLIGILLDPVASLRTKERRNLPQMRKILEVGGSWPKGMLREGVGKVVETI
ncbi:MAG: hypothetical protein ABII07_04555 [Patescibacteria group bacterium]